MRLNPHPILILIVIFLLILLLKRLPWSSADDLCSRINRGVA